MVIVEKELLAEKDREAIFRLWNSEYPEKLVLSSIAELDNYLAGLEKKRHFLLMEGNDILGWSLTFNREGERWFAMILDSSIHKQGNGTAMLNRIKQDETKIVGWVIDHERDRKTNGQPYLSPLKFYIKNQFNIIPEVRLELDRISAVKIGWQKSN